jgi:hypothetical protein
MWRDSSSGKQNDRSETMIRIYGAGLIIRFLLMAGFYVQVAAWHEYKMIFGPEYAEISSNKFALS